MKSPNPYLFIVGYPRSGTTLLQRIVDAHPAVTITPETHWVPRFYRARRGLTPDGFVTAEIVLHLLSHHRFKQLGLLQQELEELARSPVDYATFVTAVYERYGQHQGKPLVGDKTPGYVRFMPLLHGLWPGARFVHIVRDGRDVCLSVMDWDKASKDAGRFATWRDDPVVTTALWWGWTVRAGRQAGAALPSQLYREVVYEALVTDPESTTRSVCEFLDLPYDGGMLRFHEGRTRQEPGLSAKHAWLPVTNGLRDWRTQMDPESVERFEAAAGDLLDELGYERTVAHISAPVRRRVLALRERFTDEALAARWEPPAGW